MSKVQPPAHDLYLPDCARKKATAMTPTAPGSKRLVLPISSKNRPGPLLVFSPFLPTPSLGPLAIGTALVGKAPAPESGHCAAHSENRDQTPKHHHPWPVD